jgi:hypothetical protein
VPIASILIIKSFGVNITHLNRNRLEKAMQRIEINIRSYIMERERVQKAMINYLTNQINTARGGCITITTAKIMNTYNLPKNDLLILQLMLGDIMRRAGATIQKSKRNTYRYIICGSAINELAQIIGKQ